MRISTFRISTCSSVLCSNRGQSLMLALMVMFLLVFIGGLFITMLGRNISRTKRSGQSMEADYLADAGIRYASDQLTYSADLADWRPVPTPPIGAKDPDAFWLTQGFSRFTFGDGRFLLRVTYDPKLNDSMSKFIKIESIGRMGIVDEDDPTTMNINQSVRLHREKVAYKAIGITDYARFITNKDRRDGDFSLGTPNSITHFGAVVGGVTEGAPVRVNGDLLWHGRNFVWLDRGRGDAVLVSGEIKHAVRATDPNNPTGDATVVLVNNFLTRESSARDMTGQTIFNSFPDDATNSSTLIGDYRDGNPSADAVGRPRGVARLDPPILDGTRVIGSLNTYRDVTRNSGQWKYDGTQWYNTGYYGWGDGLYIDNKFDVQEESSLYTLRGDWTEPGNSKWWVGPYYIPPGMSIELTPWDLDNDDGDNNYNTGVPDMILVHDSAPGLPEFNWHNPDGTARGGDGELITMPYPKNGVIFAEGNIRIKGTLPAEPPAGETRWTNNITVVSGGTIYVEGNVLKNQFDRNGNVLAEDAEKTGSAALLATDYVCVNTTQFFGPMHEVLVAGSGGKYFDISAEHSFWVNFSFGSNSMKYVDSANNLVPVDLYVRHSKDPDAVGSSVINMLLNWPPTEAQLTTDPFYSMYKFTASDYAYTISSSAWENTLFSLCLPPDHATLPNSASYDLYTGAGVMNNIGFQLDQSGGTQGLQDYLLSRAAVQPCDIRIEALLYAQNDSFFVIPGEWFNPDPQDTYANYVANGNQRPAGVNDAWPFYGQPVDVKVTVYGAVSENISASTGDSSAWMEKWGWIPPVHGSIDPVTDPSHLTVYYRDPIDLSQDPAAQVAQQGLTFIYDAQLSYPYWRDLTALPQEQMKPVRKDQFGRVLPITPKLPVSPQTLYFGEPI